MFYGCSSREILVELSSGFRIEEAIKQPSEICIFFMYTHTMQSFLKFHIRYLIFPYSAPPRLPAFADENVAITQSISLFFTFLKFHFREIVKTETAPSNIDICEIRLILALVLRLIKHLSQADIRNIAKDYVLCFHSPISSMFFEMVSMRALDSARSASNSSISRQDTDLLDAVEQIGNGAKLDAEMVITSPSP